MNNDIETIQKLQKEICSMQARLKKYSEALPFIRADYQKAWLALDQIRIDALEAEFGRRNL